MHSFVAPNAKDLQQPACNMARASSDKVASSTTEAHPYEYLTEFYEQISADSNGKKSHTLCKLCPPCLKEQVRTSATLV